MSSAKKIETRRKISGASVGDMKSEMKSIHDDMKSMRKEMRLLQAENMSLRADNMLLQDNMKYLIQKVNSLEDEKDYASFVKEGKDPPGSFEEDSIIQTDSEKENLSNEIEKEVKVLSTSVATLVIASPQKDLAYRKRIKSMLNNSPKKKEEETPTSEQAYLGLTGRRSQIYKEINRIKSSPVLNEDDKSRKHTMNL